jgi:hypothetical protein
VIATHVRFLPTQAFLNADRTERRIILSLASVAVLFALQQTGFGFLDYVPATVLRACQAVMVGSTLLLALLGAVEVARLPRLHRRLVFAVIGMNVFYCAAGMAYGGIRPIFHLESVLVALALVPVMVDSRIWLSILRGLFVGGTVLSALNMVPLLHWAGWVNLSPTSIPRLIDIGQDISYLDPLSFGIFGRTENHQVAGRFFARLQGWALEPLHWAYFVVLTLVCGLILRALSTNRRDNRIYRWCFALLGVHMFFLNSSSLVFTIAAWGATLTGFVMLRQVHLFRKKPAGLLFFVTVIGTGFLIPFTLASVPDLYQWFEVEQTTGEGGNWADKIDFLYLGPTLFTRFMPWNRPSVTASHNLILDTYLHYGYFLSLPLLVFLYWFMRKAVTAQPLGMIAAALLVVLCHTLLLPAAMFFPSCALFVMLVVIAGYYRRHGLAPAR